MIMLGKPHGINVIFSPVYRVIRKSSGIDVYLYESKGNNVYIPLKKQLSIFFTAEIAISLTLIAAVVGVNFFFREHIGSTNLLVIILLIPVFGVCVLFQAQSGIIYSRR